MLAPSPRWRGYLGPKAAGERRGRPIVIAVAIVMATIWVAPVLGLVLISFRPRGLPPVTDWSMVLLDPAFTLDNYRLAISGDRLIPDGITPYLLNSVAVAVPATAFPLLLGCLAAYALAWMPVRRLTVSLMVIVALQLVPVQVSLLPLLEFFSTGWSLGPIEIVPELDPHRSFVPLWVAHTIFALPLAIVLMHAAISTLPRDVMDAARLDGASHVVIVRKIVLPMTLPAMAAFACLQFLLAWNDLLLAFVFTGGSSEVTPVTAFLAGIAGTHGLDVGLLSAGTVITIVLPLAVFLGAQHAYARGLLGSSIRDS